MRRVISMLILALLTTSALVPTSALAQQGFRSPAKQQRAPEPVENKEEKKAAERAYQKALQQIPNATDKKADPWKGAR